jgi:hypothetical protein
MRRFIRTAAIAVALATAALMTAPGAVASDPQTFTLQATVISSGPHGEQISLTSDDQPFGALKISKCGEDSATSFYCKGTTSGIINRAKVRVEWNCPVNKSCAGRGHGTVKSHGSTLALLTVKASPVKFEKLGATFSVKAQLVGE